VRDLEPVIRSDSELEETRAKLREQQTRVADYQRELEKDGLPAVDVEQALQPIRSFVQQLREHIKEYERIRQGELPVITSLIDLGPALVAARIAAGVTQRELAARLGVHESQVSRDEKNGYHGATIDRAAKVLASIGVAFRGSFTVERSTTDGPVL
jgi:hypothetical protein